MGSEVGFAEFMVVLLRFLLDVVGKNSMLGRRLEGFLQLKYIGRRPRLTTEQEHHL